MWGTGQFPGASAASGSRQGTPAIDPRKQAMFLAQLQALQANQVMLDDVMSRGVALPPSLTGGAATSLLWPAVQQQQQQQQQQHQQQQQQQKTSVKRGKLELVVNGVAQSAFMEASQTVFKGECSVYLCDASGTPIISSPPVAGFSLGSLGNLKVTVAGKTLSLCDGDDAALLQASTPEEALNWGRFLTTSPLSNKLVVRETPATPLTMRPPSSSSAASSSSARKPPAAHRRLLVVPSGAGTEEQKGDEEQGEEAAVGEAAAAKSKSNAKLPAQAQGKGKGRAAAGTEADEDSSSAPPPPAAALATATNRVAQIEGRIRKVAEEYCRALWEREKTVVTECRQYRSRERKRVKAGYESLSDRLQTKVMLPSERTEEEAKLNAWLAEQLSVINKMAARREERAEADYERFRDAQYATLVKRQGKLQSALQQASRQLAALCTTGPAGAEAAAQAPSLDDARRFERHEYLSLIHI